ncbi:hypothetical protein GCM10010486_84860 [Nonomuraea roseoviolacea subsp. carminata]
MTATAAAAMMTYSMESDFPSTWAPRFGAQPPIRTAGGRAGDDDASAGGLAVSLR